ncbi:hydantoinase B/oxoprolinase family protein [Amycolatopsis sp. K13G38]|uniref:Hydantoinase B/oxoprolinase family protein n=1 Tax=Amycolatopsis acididurans TaxID=2724524 RepID=A0ABX1J6X9_9PSEU|nr:hydantoinase B/oxoprolinase family protein [Amycolatopsis acididurans]NKQ55563.1 hydantoinase B/oxoprolinase family protein [Amycolatopsis acididurans]
MGTPTIPRPLLRDLSEAGFAERYHTDPFTATVLANRLRFAAQHVATGLLHRAFSPIIALAMDYICAVCGPPEQDYRMVSATNGLTVFLGTTQDGVRAAVEEYGPDRLAPGDLLVCNDPSRMGNHTNDVCFIRPVFHDNKIVSFMVLRAHMIDIGGVTPGGFSTTKRNTYESGLVISPRLLFRADEPVRETFSLIFDNVRFGEMQLPDLKTIHSCCRFGENLVADAVRRYGVEAFLGTLDYVCDTSAERMRLAIAELPDGDYEGAASVDADAIDADEKYIVRLTLHKRGDRLEVDFSGSSRQARTSINAGALDAKSAIGVGLKILLDPEGTFTSGSFRSVDIVLPPGTIASALPPDGPIFYYWEVSNAITTALIRALRTPLGERAVGGDCGANNTHNAYGVAEDGTPWACGSLAGAETGPIGANRVADGEGHLSTYLINIISPATEGLEAQFPLMVMRKEYAPDTAGPGQHRGGAAILKDVLWTAPAEHEVGPLHFRYGSGVGVNGGADGEPGGAWIFDQQGKAVDASSFVGTADEAYLPATPVAGVMDPVTKLRDRAGEFAYYGREQPWVTSPGATWRYLTNGGGGWGEALQRDPDAVKRDVRDGYVSIEAAAQHYGVVVVGDPDNDPENLEIDAEATAALRGTTAVQEEK